MSEQRNVYTWTAGSQIKGDAQRVGEELQRLQGEHGGRLTPLVVLEAGRVAASPLHPCFEWDDGIAAHHYREEQARAVLRSVRVIQFAANSDAPSAPRRVYVNITERVGDDEQRAYLPLARVITDADLFRQLCEQAAAELRAFEKRYEEFEALAEIGRVARAEVEALAQKRAGHAAPASR